MSICMIRNTWLRRFVVVITAPVLIPLFIIAAGVEAAVAMIPEAFGCLAYSWRGSDRLRWEREREQAEKSAPTQQGPTEES